MTPRGDIHVHRDPVCGLTWPCANKLCQDPDSRWCGRPLVCLGEPELHQLTRLTEIGHQLHLTEQDYTHTFHNSWLALKCKDLREQILDLVDVAHQEYLKGLQVHQQGKV